MSTPAPGRRIATRKRRPSPSLDRLSITGLALVALTALTTLGVGLVHAEHDPVARPTSVAVDETSTACLGNGPAGGSRALTLAAPLADDQAGAQAGGGEGALAVGEPGGAQEVAAPPRGRLRPVDAPGNDEAVVVMATGAAAVGRATFLTEGAGGDLLAAQECLPARSRWWFTGGGAGLDHQSELVMVNLDPAPAVVDVEVHGPEGLVDSVGTRGLTIAPGEVRTIPMIGVAPQTDELAVHVEASRGRVSAALADAFASRPGAAPGRDWIPMQAEPSRTLRLAPLPRRADRRTLVVANPSGREALVEVRVAGESGSFVPTALGDLRVPPGSVVTEDLTDVVGRDPSALVLRSPVRVTATLRSEAGGDVAYAADAPVLTGPAAAVLPDGSAGVHLTAGDKAATARVVAYSPSGEELDAAQVEVAATATSSWNPPDAAAYVVVTPRNGRVFGGVSVAGDAGVSQVPLRPLPVALREPAVVPVVR